MLKKAALTKIKILLSDHCNNLLPDVQKEIKTVKDNIDEIMGESKEQQQESKGSVAFSWQDRNSDDLKHVNTLLRDKLLSIFNSPTLATSTQDQESAYSAIHACLLILARYWPYEINYNNDGILEDSVINLELNDKNRVLSIDGSQFHYNNTQQWFIKLERAVNPSNNRPVNEKDRLYMIYHTLRLVRLNGEIPVLPPSTKAYDNGVIGILIGLCLLFYIDPGEWLLDEWLPSDPIAGIFIGTLTPALLLLVVTLAVKKYLDKLQRVPFVLPTSDPNPLATQMLDELAQYEPTLVSSSAYIQEALETAARLIPVDSKVRVASPPSPAAASSISLAPVPQSVQRALKQPKEPEALRFNPSP